MNLTQLEMGTDRNIYFYAVKIKKGLIISLFMIVGAIVVYLATENYRMII